MDGWGLLLFADFWLLVDEAGEYEEEDEEEDDVSFVTFVDSQDILLLLFKLL